MRKFTIWLTCLFFLMSIGVANAQTKVITGTVTSAEDGLPIPGVTVIVPGTTIGITTDIDGKYTLTLNAEYTTLRFQFVGMLTKDVAIGTSTVVNVVMDPDVKLMDEVVVTALGISREKKTLGYSIDEVSGDDLMHTRPTNVISALSGKMAGVQIVTASGAVGASARINIRGNSSMRTDNQPLFVVDGTPMNNSSTAVGSGNADYGNGAMDIDPNNVESMTVLKGAAAAAIYGSRALNGVIIITTKKGAINKKGIGVQYTYDIGIDRLSILPDYQNKYGQATQGDEYTYKQYQLAHPGVYSSYQEYCENESFNYYDGNWGGVNDGWDESWGPRLDIGLKFNQFNSPYTLDANGNPVYTATPWVSHPDNVKDFFETGFNQTHNLTITTGSDKSVSRFSYTNNDVTGIIPNTDQKKNTFSVNTTMKVTSKFTVNASASYIKTVSDNLAAQGYSAGNILQSMGSWFGRQVDIAPLKENWDKLDAFGKPYTWSYYYHNNPYWTVYKNTNSRDKDRLFGNIDFKYDINDWMNVALRVGTDYSTDFRKSVIYNQSNQNKKNGGNFSQETRIDLSKNADLTLNIDKELTKDIRITGLIGANYRSEYYNYQSISAAELTVPNFFDISNVNGNPTADMYTRNKETNSLYAQADASYKDFLFLGATFRNDWSSTLPTANNSYSYYSGTLGLIFTDLLKIDPNLLSFGKVRASYAVVGGDADPYTLAGYYSAVSSAWAGTTRYGFMRSLANADLKPERKKAIEAGLELKFFQNRLGIDLTYYKENTSDQIMAIDVSTATGFASKWINAGELQNKGIELALYGDIVKSKGDGFNWTMQVKYAKNDNTVVSLLPGIEKYQLSTSWSMTVQAIPGGTYGEMVGAKFLRDDNGAIIVDADGYPERTGTDQVIGNISADFNWGVSNMFSYKGLNLYVLVDGRKGGDIFSVTKMFGVLSGVLAETAQGTIREDGVIAGQNVMTNERFVKEDGSVNDIRLSANDFYANMYKLHEFAVIDGSFIKLREVSLGYDLPVKFVNKLPGIQKISLSAYARNLALLWVHKSNTCVIDPETGFGVGTSGIGQESNQLPTSRTIGFKIVATF